MEHVNINNYKVSLKICFDEDNDYNGLCNNLKPSLFFRKKCRNFFTIKIRNHAYSIYTNGHINVTGIRRISEINNIYANIINFSSIKPEYNIFRGKCFRIDNISATSYLGNPVNLYHFAQLSLIKNITLFLLNDRIAIPKNKIGIFYEPELFHAVKIVTDNGTCLLFSTGKINYLGSKSDIMLEWVVSRITILYKLYIIVKSDIHLYNNVYDMSEYINYVVSSYIDPKNHLLFAQKKEK
jgi:TATA-box binding protein (TBP) (component of TFIID and TFIIIB)